MACRATQDGQVRAESSDKTWSTGGGNGKPPQYTCRETSWTVQKDEKDMTPKDESPRLEGVQYAPGEEGRTTTQPQKE